MRLKNSKNTFSIRNNINLRAIRSTRHRQQRFKSLRILQKLLRLQSRTLFRFNLSHIRILLNSLNIRLMSVRRRNITVLPTSLHPVNIRRYRQIHTTNATLDFRQNIILLLRQQNMLRTRSMLITNMNLRVRQYTLLDTQALEKITPSTRFNQAPSRSGHRNNYYRRY